MRNTTLCYIERDDAYLMLHRNKKQNDLNHGKWVGIGGKFEKGESPQECLLREVREETGLTLTRWRYRGIVTFISDVWEAEFMHLFTADGFYGDLIPCNEGDLAWIPKQQIDRLPIWEGDRIFFSLLHREYPFFSLKLVYRGDTLVSATLDGKPFSIVP